MITITPGGLRDYRACIAQDKVSEILAALQSRWIESAADYGAPFVRLGTGQRLVLRDHCVVAVLPQGFGQGRLRRRAVQPELVDV